MILIPEKRRLNLAGKILGIKRKFFESNKEYRKRLMKYFEKNPYNGKSK